MKKPRATPTVRFDGVKVSSDFYTGTISSRDLIENFSPEWIPSYQRARITNRSKVAQLKELFKTNSKVDSLKINFSGEAVDCDSGVLLSGDFRIIDGQQRLLALIDSDVRDIRIPVELYLNLEKTEEVKLFHQFNRLQSKLTFGDLAKSTQGPFGIKIQEILGRRNFPVRITTNSDKTGVSLSLLCPVFYQVFKKRTQNMDLASHATGGQLIKFLELPDVSANEVAMTEFAVRQIFESFVDIFGEYDNTAWAYRRTFMLGFCRLVAKHFLTDTGKVNYGKFKSKMYSVPTKLLTNAAFRDVVSIGSYSGAQMVEEKLIQYLNFKLKTGHLSERIAKMMVAV